MGGNAFSALCILPALLLVVNITSWWDGKHVAGFKRLNKHAAHGLTMTFHVFYITDITKP